MQRCWGNAQFKAAHATESDVHYCMKANMVKSSSQLYCQNSPIYYDKGPCSKYGQCHTELKCRIFFFLQLTVYKITPRLYVKLLGQRTIAITCIAYGSSPCMQLQVYMKANAVIT